MTTPETWPRKIRSLSYFTMPDGGVSGYLARPGDIIDVDANMYHRSLDVAGNSWLHLTPAEQRARYGAQRFEVLQD